MMIHFAAGQRDQVSKRTWLRCKHSNALNGELCNKPFSNASNLKRHIRKEHGSESITFVHHSSSGERRKSINVVSSAHQSHLPMPQSSAFVIQPPTTSLVDLQNLSSGAMSSELTLPAKCRHPCQHQLPSADDEAPFQPEPDPPTSVGTWTAPSTQKRRRSSTLDSRRTNFQRRPVMPKYEVKQSKKRGNQQRALEWLSEKGLTAWREDYYSRLASWARKTGYKAPCLLLPDEWKAANPLDLLALFDGRNFPPFDARRASYSYADHSTAMARAAAWYSEWPRTGIELDNFLNCGPYGRMDASHLCHQKHCINSDHIIYELAIVNQDRNFCCEYAKFLRQEGRAVPEHCDKHEPPCLMHVSISHSIDGRILTDSSMLCYRLEKSISSSLTSFAKH